MNKNTIILFYILTMMLLSQSAIAKVIHGTVIDKESGEPLPGVTVTISKANRTITNIEGNFELEASDNDNVTFTFIGFDTQTFKASALPPVIKLRESSFTLQDVVITNKDDIAEIKKKIKEDSRKYSKHSAHFFNRVSLENPDGYTELIETFLEAQNVAALKNIKICSGNYWSKSGEGLSNGSTLESTDIDKFFLLSPYINHVSFWKNFHSPLHSEYSTAMTRKYYDIKREIMSEGGKTTLRYTFTAKDLSKGGIIDGILYVDGETMAVERFEGTLHRLPIRLSLVSTEKNIIPIDVKFTINYNTSEGYSEIDNMNINVTCQAFELSSTMLNIEDTKLPWGYGLALKSNYMNDVKEAGYDPQLYKNTDFIQHTEKDEDLIAQGQSSQEKPQLKASETPHERAYLHLDNTGYFLGETVWFKAYVMRTDLQKMTDLSSVLYVELLDPTGNVVQTKKLKLQEGMANGSFNLKGQQLVSGFYEVRAYTRYMTAWGSDACYSKIIPVFNEPKTPGDYSNPRIVFDRYKQRLPNYRTENTDATESSDTIITVGVAQAAMQETDEEDAEITVTPITKSITPYGTVEMTIHTAPYSRLSVTVTDADAIVNGKKDDITTVMQRPDLLPLNPLEGKRQVIEKGLRLEGKLIAKKKKDRGRMNDVNLLTTLYHANGRSASAMLKTDEEGRFFTEMPNIPGEWNLYLESKRDSNIVDAYISIDRNFSPAPRIMNKEDVMPVPVDTTNIIRLTCNEASFKDVLEGKLRLSNVDVIGKNRKKISAPWYSERNISRYASIYYDCEKEQEKLIDEGKEIFGLAEFLKYRNPLFEGDDNNSIPIVALPVKKNEDDFRLYNLETTGGATGLKGLVVYSDYDPCDSTRYADNPPSGFIRFWEDGMSYSNRPIIWIVDNTFCTITNIHARKNGEILNIPCGGEKVKIPLQALNVFVNNNTTNILLDLPVYLDELRSIYVSEDDSQSRNAFFAPDINSNHPIVVNLYTQGKVKNKPGTRSTFFQGYDVPEAFITARTAKMSANDEDYRRTLYWNPNLRTNKYGDVTISFPNTAVCRNMKINVEGVTKTGKFISK